MSLFWSTLLLWLHHHTVLYASALGHTSSWSTSPYCTLRHCLRSPYSTLSHSPVHHTLLYVTALDHTSTTSTPPYSVLCRRLRAYFFIKYITTLPFVPLPWTTFHLLIHRQRGIYITALGHTSTSSSPYSTLHHRPRSHFSSHTSP